MRTVIQARDAIGLDQSCSGGSGGKQSESRYAFKGDSTHCMWNRKKGVGGQSGFSFEQLGQAAGWGLLHLV